MTFLVGRVLLLAAALPLALPHGWCCLVMPRAVAATAAKPAGGCPHCCQAATTEQPARPVAPPSKPCPGDPAKCPCGDRASTAPEVFKASPDVSKSLSCDISLRAASAPTATHVGAIPHRVEFSAALPVSDLVIALRHFLI
jgi:hypothetical protein